MMRSLFSGISGLQGHQVKMDVIADNIANVNTTGFKKSRTIFSNIFNQTIGYPSAPSDTMGGVNPKQVGLGTQVSAIDRIMTQGATETTGNASDAAISGDGFFIVNNGEKDVYTRAGNFMIDSLGDLVHGSTGGRVMGWPAEWNGDAGEFQVETGTVPDTINFLNLEKLPAKATTDMVFKSNLISSADARSFPEENTLTYISGSTYEEDIKFKMEKVNDTKWIMTGFDDLGNPVDLDPNTAGTQTQAFVNLYDNGKIKNIEVGGNYDIYSVSANATPGVLDNFTITLAPSTPPTVNYWTYEDVNGDVQKMYVNFEKASISTATCDVYNFRLYDEDGNLMDISGDGVPNEIQDFGTMSISSVTGKMMSINASGGFAGPRNQLNLNGVTLDLSISNDLRQMVLTDSSSGKSREIGLESDKIDIRLGGTSNSMSFAFIPGTSHSTSMAVYDSKGVAHTLKTNFEKLDENKWRYYTTLSADDPIVQDYIAKFPDSVEDMSTPTNDELLEISRNVFWDAENGYTGEGVILFNTLGRVDQEATAQANGVNYPQLVQEVSFTPPGAEQVDVLFDIEGITQYDSDGFTTAARSQNGYEMGMLTGYSIDNDGTIVGSYTNDRKQAIGQLAMAVFQNPAGLEKLKGSMWTTSGNSGEAVIRVAGTGGAGTIESGKLEMSNVDLSQEFTDMIIAQRGFQANSKSITTADQLLQELINLKR